MYVRGSSRKEAVDTNKKLMIFLIHDDAIYTVTRFKKEPLTLKFYCSLVPDTMSKINDNKLFFLQATDDQVGKLKPKNEIKRIKCDNTYMNITNIYKIDSKF